MGSAPQIPSYHAPSGQPGYTPNQTIGFNQLAAANAQGGSGIYGSAGWGGQTGVDLNSPFNQAVAAQTLGYNISDQDFARRYPQMVQARGQYQNYLNNLLGTQTQTSMNAGNTLMGQGNQLVGTGQQLASSGMSLLPTGQNIIRSGQNVAAYGSQFFNPATRLAQTAQSAGQPDISLGQRLINGQQAMDPMVQQELMRSGLSSAAGSLGGAAALGGTAGQAAVGRQLGVGAQNYINSQRQMGMQLQQTGGNLTGSLAGAAGSLAGAGAGAVNAGSGLINAGSGVYNAGSSAVGTGASAQSAGANMVGTGQNVVNSAVTNANQSFALGSGLFQPRTFGISGSDAANVTLANTAGQNNMNQFLYATRVQGAQYNNQIAASNANAQAQSQGQAVQGGVGVATTAATVATAFAMSCWLAAAAFGRETRDFYRFRFWLHNCGPLFLRCLYQRYAKSVAPVVERVSVIKSITAVILRFLCRDVSRDLVSAMI